MPCHGFLSSVIGPDNRRPSATWLPNCHDSKRCARRHGRTPRHRRTSGSGQHTAADFSSAKAGAQLAHPGHSLLAQPARASAASSKLPSVADGEADHQARGTPELSSRLASPASLTRCSQKGAELLSYHPLDGYHKHGTQPQRSVGPRRHQKSSSSCFRRQPWGIPTLGLKRSTQWSPTLKLTRDFDDDLGRSSLSSLCCRVSFMCNRLVQGVEIGHAQRACLGPVIDKTTADARLLEA